MRHRAPVSRRSGCRLARGAAFLLLVALTSTLAAGPLGAEEGAGAREERRLADALRLLDLWIAERVAYEEIPGLAIGVVRGDRTLWTKGYGVADLATGAPVTPATPFRLGSVSKLFTATATLQLRDRGKLGLDDPILRHLPWFRIESPYAGAPPITVRQLLTHTSGLPREGAFPYWTTHQFPERDALHAAIAGQKVFSAPGATYRYSNLGMALLGEIVERASGEPYADYLTRRVLQPLGMLSSTAAPTEADVQRLAHAYQRRRAGEPRREIPFYPTGVFTPMGGVISTVDDLVLFLALELSADAGGSAEAGPRRVVAGPTLAEMQRLQFVYPSFAGGRGLGFAVSRRDGRTFVGHGGWIGGHRAALELDPAHKLGVVVLTNADDAAPAPFAQRALALLGEAIDGAVSAASSAEKTADPAWSSYYGKYSDPWGWEYEVLTLDGDLILYEHDYPTEEDPAAAFNRLIPVPGEPHTFTMGDGERVRFEMNPDGSVHRLQRRYEFLEPLRPAS